MPGKHYGKKSSGFKMGGMNFGGNYQKDMGSTMMQNSHTMLPEVKLTASRDKDNKDDKDSRFSKNKAGYDVKTTRRKNLLGREREVKKYFDPKTGEKVGKQVTVDRAEGDPRAKKRKIKKVNPGLTQSGGVGKIRLKENPWEGKSGSGVEMKGKKTLSTYDEAWDDKRFTKKDGKRTDKFGNVYDDSEAGKQDFVKASKEFWSKQAGDTGNEDLLIDSQTGKKQSSMKKKRGYKMKGSPLKKL